MEHHYDIIIAGAGLSGLTLALELARRPFFRGGNILLIDRDTKQHNDRTWCFWATPDEPLPALAHKVWDHCRFYAPDFQKDMDISPYQYHMVRGLDYYRWAHEQLAQAPNIFHLTAHMHRLVPDLGEVYTDQGVFRASVVFNSAFTQLPLLPAASPLYPTPPITQQPAGAPSPHHVWLLQHFKGWVVETLQPAFDESTVTFMDYRLEQKGETRFVYVLPLSPHRALVEFTVFSPTLCAPEEYTEQLRLYLKAHLHLQDYRIVEEEFGVIPMTDAPLVPLAEGRVIHIGTVGGFVKASSGYAFKRTQRKIRTLVDDWEKHGKLHTRVMQSASRYRFFDSVMLQVLHRGAVSGSTFFSLLFRKLPAHEVFRFLDEDATLWQHARIATAPPTWPFMKTALRKIFS